MKKKYKFTVNEKSLEREYNYIPFRYILAVFITLFEVLAVIGIVIALSYYVPYFCTDAVKKATLQEKCKLLPEDKQNFNICML